MSPHQILITAAAVMFCVIGGIFKESPMELKKNLISTQELLEAAYSEMEQHRQIAAKHFKDSETALCHDACMRSIGEMAAKLVGVAPNIFTHQFANGQRYTASKAPDIVCLCENVFEFARIAESMEIDRSISVPDPKELFYCILDWAKEFEQTFDPDGGEDYLCTIETFADQKLKENFPFDSELEEKPVLLAHQEIIDYIRFEAATAEIFPWYISAEEMLADTKKLAEVQSSLLFYRDSGYNTDELQEALDKAFGVNPMLIPGSGQEQSL